MESKVNALRHRGINANPAHSSYVPRPPTSCAPPRDPTLILDGSTPRALPLCLLQQEWSFAA